MLFLVGAEAVFALVAVDETGATTKVFFFLLTALEEDLVAFEEATKGAWAGLPPVVSRGHPSVLKRDGFNVESTAAPPPSIV